MYETIIIKIGLAQAQFKTVAYDSIYDFLTSHGYSHHVAADVADWADLAPVGAEYELDGKIIAVIN